MHMHNSKIVLFDMDGTLTPPRKSIEKNIIEVLSKLSKHTKIGVVTGSGYDYVVEQCSDLWSSSIIDPSNIILFPCNGTQVYTWSGSTWKEIFRANMKEELWELTYKKLVRAILAYNPELPIQILNYH